MQIRYNDNMSTRQRTAVAPMPIPCSEVAPVVPGVYLLAAGVEALDANLGGTGPGVVGMQLVRVRRAADVDALVADLPGADGVRWEIDVRAVRGRWSPPLAAVPAERPGYLSADMGPPIGPTPLRASGCPA
jgi:hypothetical protein